MEASHMHEKTNNVFHGLIIPKCRLKEIYESLKNSLLSIKQITSLCLGIFSYQGKINYPRGNENILMVIKAGAIKTQL